MEAHKYELNIFWSTEDELFVAEVPDLPGCMAHGRSATDAVRNVQDAMSLWIDTAREDGEPIPRPTVRRSTIKR